MMMKIIIIITRLPQILSEKDYKMVQQSKVLFLELLTRDLKQCSQLKTQL
jgi:hypothetical protein